MTEDKKKKVTSLIISKEVNDRFTKSIAIAFVKENKKWTKMEIVEGFINHWCEQKEKLN